ncbi:MAG: phasin family protein [Rhizobiales bacterium]|nr:phasin family protein [Hyphomicrobiales bacterium]
MINGFESVQKASKDGVDMTMKSMDAFGKGMQAIAVEAADYSKKSFESGTAALEKLMAAKSLDKAVEVQSEYVKSAYEGYVGEMTKLQSMMTEFAKDAYKPFEAMFGKLPK